MERRYMAFVVPAIDGLPKRVLLDLHNFLPEDARLIGVRQTESDLSVCVFVESMQFPVITSGECARVVRPMCFAYADGSRYEWNWEDVANATEGKVG